MQAGESIKENFSKLEFDTEHALVMHATSLCTFPVEAMYDNNLMSQYKSIIRDCHIYIIGFLPILDLRGVCEENGEAVFDFTTIDRSFFVREPIPEGMSLKIEGGGYYLQASNGTKYTFNRDHLYREASVGLDADSMMVMYVGQAYGTKGSRSALDRLRKHETLQKIAIKQAPPGKKLTALLLAVKPSTKLVTMINPHAKNRDDSGARIKSGLDKLRTTTELERITLYEASLIRHFAPEYNTEYKNSFPSTNMKVLNDCYEKDINAIVAEINFDAMPFKLMSKSVTPALTFMIKHDLHKSESRKVFFGIG